MPAKKTDYHTYSDSQLIDLLRVSDHAAFAEIFKRFGPLLFSITQRRVNNKELSKDLIQEVFASLWEKRLTIHIPGNLQSFLITVIKNRILDHYRHHKVARKYVDHFHEYLKTDQNNTDYLLRHNNYTALIEKEIAALPEKMRVVFKLSRKEHLNRKEIAEFLCMPEATVRINMNRALKKLKVRLGSLLPLLLFFLL